MHLLEHLFRPKLKTETVLLLIQPKSAKVIFLNYNKTFDQILD